MSEIVRVCVTCLNPKASRPPLLLLGRVIWIYVSLIYELPRT